VFAIRTTFEDDELPALYEIEKECFTEEFRWSERVMKRALLSARDADPQKNPRNYVWIATISGRLAGYLLAGTEDGEVTIETVNIPKRARRKGVASRLIAACEKDMAKRGFKEITLEVSTDNPAQVLYFNLGYRVIGFLRHYYKHGFHALTMSKKL